MSQQYTQLCNKFYNFTTCFLRSSYGEHLTYAFHTTKNYLPKASYQNPYEDQYTQTHIKNNYLIVFALFGTSIYLTKTRKEQLINENNDTIKENVIYSKYRV